MNSESQIITTIMFHEENTGFGGKKSFPQNIEGKTISPSSVIFLHVN